MNTEELHKKTIYLESQLESINRQLSESEGKIRFIIDDSPYPLVVLDENDETVLFWSKSEQAMFGHNPKSTGECFQLVYPDTEYRKEVREHWKPYIKTCHMKSEFSLNDLLMELFSLFNLKSREQNIHVYFKRGLSDDQSYIISDKSKLNKIMSKLPENALKFTNEGDVYFGYTLEEDSIRLFVRDTGLGIAPENHQSIFEGFSQEDKNVTPQHGGLYLGLSWCKENVRLLGGDIQLESEKGTGSTFYVTIPYKTADHRKSGAT